MAQAELAPEKFDSLVEQMNSGDFKERRAARTELLEAGPDQVKQLGTLLGDKDPELATQAHGLFKKFLASESAEVNAAAKAAIAKQAEGSGEQAIEAKRFLAEIEKNEKVARPKPGNELLFDLGAIQFGNGINFQNLKIEQIGGNSRSVEVSENGKKVNISEKNGVIDMFYDVEEKGAIVRKTAKAKNLKELEQNDPAAFALFNKHMKAAPNLAGAGANMRIEIGKIQEQLQKQLGDIPQLQGDIQKQLQQQLKALPNGGPGVDMFEFKLGQDGEMKPGENNKPLKLKENKALGKDDGPDATEKLANATRALEKAKADGVTGKDLKKLQRRVERLKAQ